MIQIDFKAKRKPIVLTSKVMLILYSRNLPECYLRFTLLYKRNFALPQQTIMSLFNIKVNTRYYLLHIIICYYLLSYTLTGCKKNNFYDNTAQVDQIKLPPYSETGSNTFGFLVNDSAWTVFGETQDTHDIGNPWFPNQTSAYIEANTYYGDSLVLGILGYLTIVKQDTVIRNEQAHIEFLIDPTMKIGTYILTGNTNPYEGYFSLIKQSLTLSGFDKHYSVSSSNPFIIELAKLDTMQKIFSGRFQGVIYLDGDPANNDSLTITEGRFDAKFYRQY